MPRPEGRATRIRVLLGLIALAALAWVALGPLGLFRREVTFYPPQDVAIHMQEEVWKWIAGMECPRAEWSPDYSSTDNYRRSVEPIRKELLSRIGSVPDQQAGEVIERRLLAQGEGYSVEWVRIKSRLSAVSVPGYLVHPTNAPVDRPAALLVHGVGLPPHAFLGWRLPGDQNHFTTPPDGEAANLAVRLAGTGLTVFAPWLEDNSGNWAHLGFESLAWPDFPWFEYSRWGTIARRKAELGGEYGLLVPHLLGALDFLVRQQGRSDSPLAAIGWGEGAHLAGTLSALDARVTATVFMSLPVPGEVVFSDPGRLKDGAPFSPIGCSLGPVELAALIAPIPLKFQYNSSAAAALSIDDGAIRDAADRISAGYTGLGAGDRVALAASPLGSDPATDISAWLDTAAGFTLRHTGPSSQVLPAPAEWAYPMASIAKTRAEMVSYLASTGECDLAAVRVDSSSRARLEATAQALRQEMVNDIVGDLPEERPIVILERRTVHTTSQYRLDWVRYTGRLVGVEMAGYLALPRNKEGPVQAVLSLDGNYDQRWLYGLIEQPFPYLNAYGDALAQAGYVVFSPYMPSELGDGWGATLSAKTGRQRTIWSYLIPLYMSGIDLLRSQPEVDSQRVAIYGISFAGTAALVTASIDERISAVVMANGFGHIDQILATSDGEKLPVWSTELCPYLPALVTGQLVAPRPFVWENGALDASTYLDRELEIPDEARALYRRLGYPNRFLLKRHGGGHETRPEVTIPALEEAWRSLR